jgi:hypothetical protein
MNISAPVESYQLKRDWSNHEYAHVHPRHQWRLCVFLRARARRRWQPHISHQISGRIGHPVHERCVSSESRHTRHSWQDKLAIETRKRPLVFYACRCEKRKNRARARSSLVYTMTWGAGTANSGAGAARQQPSLMAEAQPMQHAGKQQRRPCTHSHGKQHGWFQHEPDRL